jgi:hypothetical protein
VTGERTAEHACGETVRLWQDSVGVWHYYTADWEPILDGKCPRCRRRLLRSRLRQAVRETTRGEGR